MQTGNSLRRPLDLCRLKISIVHHSVGSPYGVRRKSVFVDSLQRLKEVSFRYHLLCSGPQIVILEAHDLLTLQNSSHLQNFLHGVAWILYVLDLSNVPSAQSFKRGHRIFYHAQGCVTLILTVLPRGPSLLMVLCLQLLIFFNCLLALLRTKGLISHCFQQLFNLAALRFQMWLQFVQALLRFLQRICHRSYLPYPLRKPSLLRSCIFHSSSKHSQKCADQGEKADRCDIVISRMLFQKSLRHC
mmetsp:Transcript_984/g.1719  ORF Transcript_984/g.1719 Transcript_984/m.1719 type:complete len:244 (-) Transcript_984:274-1005(-)